VLLDLQTATELEAKSTGNATGQGPAPHHLLLEPGTAACQELKEQLDEGILVYNTMGAWAGNPYSGHVSGTLSLAFKLEGGEVVGRIKNCMFSLNAFEQLRSGLIGLTQETEEVTATAPGLGGATLPYLALEDVVISTE
jgi:PmbA protein